MKKDIINTGVFIAPKRYHDSYNTTIKHNESGQVFSEVSRPGGPMTLEWVWKTQGSPKEAARSRSSDSGCSSLAKMAIRSILGHSIHITTESLEELPWEVASPLWESLVASYARFGRLTGTNEANNRTAVDN